MLLLINVIFWDLRLPNNNLFIHFDRILTPTPFKFNYYLFYKCNENYKNNINLIIIYDIKN